jgi:hypothetical protein
MIEVNDVRNQNDLELAEVIRTFLTPDLLPKGKQDMPFPMGHCYHASEALYHLTQSQMEHISPAYVTMGGGKHWFLVTEHGIVWDITQDQFDTPPDYSQGVRCGFLTVKPSKKAQKVIEGAEQWVKF